MIHTLWCKVFLIKNCFSVAARDANDRGWPRLLPNQRARQFRMHFGQVLATAPSQLVHQRFSGNVSIWFTFLSKRLIGCYHHPHQAPPEFLTEFKPLFEGNGLVRTKLGLSFRATRDYFKHDNLRLRCAASLMLVYELKAVDYLVDGTKKPKTSSKRYTNG